MGLFLASWHLSHKRHAADEIWGFKLLFAFHYICMNHLFLSNRSRMNKHTVQAKSVLHCFCTWSFAGTRSCPLFHLLFVAGRVGYLWQRPCGLKTLKYVPPSPLHRKLADVWNKPQLKHKQHESSPHFPAMWQKNQYGSIPVYLDVSTSVVFIMYKGWE